MSLPISLSFIVVYLILCGISAFLGRKRRIGFWGFFFLSILITPIITALFIFAAAPAPRPRRVVPKRP